MEPSSSGFPDDNQIKRVSHMLSRSSPISLLPEQQSSSGSQFGHLDLRQQDTAFAPQNQAPMSAAELQQLRKRTNSVNDKNAASRVKEPSPYTGKLAGNRPRGMSQFAKSESKRIWQRVGQKASNGLQFKSAIKQPDPNDPYTELVKQNTPYFSTTPANQMELIDQQESQDLSVDDLTDQFDSLLRKESQREKAIGLGIYSSGINLSGAKSSLSQGHRHLSDLRKKSNPLQSDYSGHGSITIEEEELILQEVSDLKKEASSFSKSIQARKLNKDLLSQGSSSQLKKQFRTDLKDSQVDDYADLNFTMSKGASVDHLQTLAVKQEHSQVKHRASRQQQTRKTTIASKPKAIYQKQATRITGVSNLKKMPTKKVVRKPPTQLSTFAAPPDHKKVNLKGFLPKQKEAVELTPLDLVKPEAVSLAKATSKGQGKNLDDFLDEFEEQHDEGQGLDHQVTLGGAPEDTNFLNFDDTQRTIINESRDEELAPAISIRRKSDLPLNYSKNIGGIQLDDFIAEQEAKRAQSRSIRQKKKEIEEPSFVNRHIKSSALKNFRRKCLSCFRKSRLGRKPSVDETMINQLQQEMSEMVKDEQAAQIRARRRWKKLQAHVKNMMMVKRIKSLQRMSTMKSQKGDQIGDDEDLSELLDSSKKVIDLPFWQTQECFIKMDSQFYWFWSIVFPLILGYCLYKMPLIIASQNLILFLEFHLNSKSSLILLATTFVFDILFNLVCEQHVSEVKKGVLMKDSAQAYLKKYFILDVLATIFPVVIAFINHDYISKCLFVDLFKTLAASSDLDLSPDQLEAVQQYQEKYQVSLDEFDESANYFFMRLMLISRFLFFVKFLQIERIVGFIRTYRETIESLPYMRQNGNTTDVAISLTLMMARVLLIIHIVTCVWMRFSSYVFSLLGLAFTNFLKDSMDGDVANFGIRFEDLLSSGKLGHDPWTELNHEVDRVHQQQFYLLSLTLTVIGYGDSTSMPNLTDFKMDYQVLLVCMLLGFLSFQQTQAQLANILGSIMTTEFTSRQALDNSKEHLEQYVFLFHNLMEGPKKINLHEFESFKKQLEVNFLYNYSDISTSSYFQELTPNLQRKLLVHLIQPEIEHFSHLFFDVPRGARFGQKQLMVSQDTIFQILACIENEELISGTSSISSRIILPAKEEFNYFYMIKKGSVRCFSKEYVYLYSLEEGSFFGEYNIMFGLYSSLYYQGENHGEQASQLFKIDKTKLMNFLCKDIVSFKHFHNLSVQKYRFNKKMLGAMSSLKAKESKKEMAQRKKLGEELDIMAKIKSYRKIDKTILLYDVLQLMSKQYGIANEDIQEFYNQIKFRRFFNLEKKQRKIFEALIASRINKRKETIQEIIKVQEPSDTSGEPSALKQVEKTPPVTLNSRLRVADLGNNSASKTKAKRTRSVPGNKQESPKKKSVERSSSSYQIEEILAKRRRGSFIKPPDNSLLLKLKSKVNLPRVKSAYLDDFDPSSDEDKKDKSLTSKSFTSDEEEETNWIDSYLDKQYTFLRDEETYSDEVNSEDQVMADDVIGLRPTETDNLTQELIQQIQQASEIEMKLHGMSLEVKLRSLHMNSKIHSSQDQVVKSMIKQNDGQVHHLKVQQMGHSMNALLQASGGGPGF